MMALRKVDILGDISFSGRANRNGLFETVITNETKGAVMKEWLSIMLARMLARLEHARQLKKIQKINTLPAPTSRGRETLETLAQSLDPEVFRHYTPSAVFGMEVNVLYPSIETYNKELKEVSLRIMQEAIISPAWADRDVRTISLREFFISNDGCYLNAYEEVRTLRDEVLVLTALFHKIEKAAYGVQEHNRRILTRFAVSLESILQSLIAVSLELSPQR
jgi:hypothetical protein